MADVFDEAQMVSSFHLSNSPLRPNESDDIPVIGVRAIGLNRGIGTTKASRRQLMKEDEVLEEENMSVSPEDRIQEVLREGKSSGVVLDLDHMRMTTCPQKLTSFSDALEELYLQKNYLTELPTDLGFLSNLQILNVNSNRLTSIPSSIAMCVCLTKLNLSNNLLTYIPVELEDCVALEQIFLDFNYLQSFPSVCLCLPKLQALYLIENSEVNALPDYALFEKRCMVSNSAHELVIQIDNTMVLREQWKVYEAKLNTMSARTATISIMWNRIWPDLVEEGIYLGSLRTTQNPSVFAELGITHILTCGRNLRTKLPGGVQQLVLEVDDNDEEQLDRHFRRAIEYMEGTSEAPGCKKVLVHCFAGVSRSATVMIAYHMLKHKKGFNESLTFVQKRRPAINPNQNFCQQLRHWETVVLK